MQAQISPYMSVLSSRINNQDVGQKSNKNITPVASKSIRSLETPNAFYNRQLVLAKKHNPNVNFEGFHLAEVSGLHCPCCGKMMYTQTQIDKLGDRLSKARGGEIAKVLKPHIEELHKVERQVAEFLIEKSAEHPKKDVKELLMMQRSESNAFLIDEQMKILNPAIQKARELKGRTRPDVINSLNQIKKFVVEGNGNEPFKRKKVIKTINHYALLEKNSPNSRILNEMATKIEALPTSGQDFHAFVTKYTDGKRDSSEISTRLFTPNLSTREHVDPAWRNTEDAEHGPTSIGNSLAMDLECNGERKTTPYYIFVPQSHPEMKENLPKHMEEVQHYLRKRDMPAYYSYPLEIRERLRKQSTPPGSKKPMLDFDTSLTEEFIYKKIDSLKELSEKYKSDKK
jgi:hypothetical protein